MKENKYDEKTFFQQYSRMSRSVQGLEGTRLIFLGEDVVKYHRTLTTYLNSLLHAGFSISSVVEPMPAPDLLAAVPDMKEELRRPMMLLVAAKKLNKE